MKKLDLTGQRFGNLTVPAENISGRTLRELAGAQVQNASEMSR